MASIQRNSLIRVFCHFLQVFVSSLHVVISANACVVHMSRQVNAFIVSPNKVPDGRSTTKSSSSTRLSTSIPTSSNQSPPVHINRIPSNASSISHSYSTRSRSQPQQHGSSVRHTPSTTYVSSAIFGSLAPLRLVQRTPLGPTVPVRHPPAQSLSLLPVQRRPTHSVCHFPFQSQPHRPPPPSY